MEFWESILEQTRILQVKEESMITIECFQKVSAYADYITVNISSPNTPRIEILHSKENFLPLFKAINQARNNENIVILYL